MATDTSKRCKRKGCGMLAQWQPVMVIRWRDDQWQPIEASLSLAVCGKHRDKTKIKHILSDDGWRAIMNHLRQSGVPLPTRALTQLRWEPVVHASPVSRSGPS